MVPLLMVAFSISRSAAKSQDCPPQLRGKSAHFKNTSKQLNHTITLFLKHK